MDNRTWITRRLERARTLPMCDAQGAGIACVSGELWITQEGDSRDVVIGPGQTFFVDRPGLTLLHATKPSVVRMQALNHDALKRCVESSARRMRRAMLAEAWQWLRARMPRVA